jgi:cytochrome c5
VSHADDVFVKNFLAVLTALVVFTIVAFFLARTVGFGAQESIHSRPEAVAKRIQPVGQVQVGEAGAMPVSQQAPALASSTPVTPAAETEKSGEEVYNSTCFACHSTGAAGAPKLGDKEDWDARVDQGLAVLIESVMQGKNAMPAKGGNPKLSEAEIEKAVEYMLAETGLPVN